MTFNDEFAHHEMKAGRVINLDFLNTIGFPYIDTFSNLGWLNYLGLNVAVFENLVRVFYSNATRIARIGGENCFHMNMFKIYLMGQEIEVTRKLIANSLDLSDDGIIDDESLHVDDIILAQKVFNDENLPFAYSQVSRLGMYDCLLHLIVTHILAPFGTQYSTIRKQDYWWTYMIKSEKKTNLAIFIFKDIMKVVSQTESTLVYGMVFTCIFTHLGIDLSYDVATIQSVSTHLNEHSLKVIGYAENADHEWVKKTGHAPIDPNEAALRGDDIVGDDVGDGRGVGPVD
ncbi:hypothetical protein DITRI_Ditri03aG0042200 [Diplodiscus trichospermus]